MRAKLYMLTVVALRNLVSHRVKSTIVGGIMAFGTFLLVLGTSLLGSIEASMERAITASLTGDLQVWSADSEDELALFGGGMGGENDIGELTDFGATEERLLAVDGVRAVVPMATGNALSFGKNEIDDALANLRRGIASNDPETRRRGEEQVKMIAELLREEFQNELEVSASPQTWQEKLDLVARVLGEAFWQELDAAPDEGLLFLESQIAPLAPEGQFIYVRYLATDPAQFASTFDRFQVVDGEAIPQGRRGLMLSKRYYERGVKHKVARELDWLKEQLDKGQAIAGDPVLESRVKQLSRRWPDVVFQLEQAEASALRGALARFLGADDELPKLVERFLTVDDANFSTRYDWFYAHVAPLVTLYAVRPGDRLTLQGFTKSGYFKSVNVKFYGTFNFRGLESSDLTQALNILDLVTFRELYGKMTAQQKEELAEIREDVGATQVGGSGEDLEDALFGGDDDLVADVETSDLDELIPAELTRPESIDDRVYSTAEMREGLALHAAVLLDEGRDLAQTIEAIRSVRADGKTVFKATDWQTASGMLGQFVLVVSLVLYIAIFIIFLVALVIINNSMLMAMMERVGEIGTIRAMGGQRREVMLMVFLETLVLCLVSGLLGGGVAAGLVLVLGNVGIPATTDVAVFLFGGPRLYPTVSASDVAGAFLVVLFVSLVSTLFPARVATQVQPVVAMRGGS